MKYAKTYILTGCFFIFSVSCKKENNPNVETVSDNEHMHQMESMMHAANGENDALFYDFWKSDSLVAFEACAEAEKLVIYTDSFVEKNDFTTKKIHVMRGRDKKIIKLTELDELNDGSLKTELSACFKNGNLIFIEYLNDMINEPSTSYYIKSAVSGNEFDVAHFHAKTRVSINGSMNLPVEKASSECIFNALVLYDRMKAKFDT